jgi:hypothetical protein
MRKALLFYKFMEDKYTHEEVLIPRASHPYGDPLLMLHREYANRGAFTMTIMLDILKLTDIHSFHKGNMPIKSGYLKDQLIMNWTYILNSEPLSWC